MSRPVNQTKVAGTAPLVDHTGCVICDGVGWTSTPPPTSRGESIVEAKPVECAATVSAHLVVNSTAFENATPQAVEDLHYLIGSAISRRGGDAGTIIWTSEPVGTQIRVATVDGVRL